MAHVIIEAIERVGLSALQVNWKGAGKAKHHPTGIPCWSRMAGPPIRPARVKLGATHEILTQSAGERVRGGLHVQTVNSRHARLKTFSRRQVNKPLTGFVRASGPGFRLDDGIRFHPFASSIRAIG